MGHLKKDENCANTNWKIFTEIEEIKVNNTRNTNYLDRGTRNEIVIFGNSQTFGIESYANILNDFNVEMSILLQERINIKKADPKPNHDTLTFWYLLFGCEVIKNPAALIHNNMVFDLIKGENDKNKLKMQITDLLPMCMQKAIPNAMRLNSEYAEFMPHRYLYQIKNNFTEAGLETKEANITKKWLELKLTENEEISKDIIIKCETDNNAVIEIWNLIIGSFDEWGLALS
jgi:hypothetical protein